LWMSSLSWSNIVTLFCLWKVEFLSQRLEKTWSMKNMKIQKASWRSDVILHFNFYQLNFVK